MNFWWDEKVNKKKVLKTFENIKKTIEMYERFEFGARELIPLQAQKKIKETISAIKKLDEFTAYYKEIKEVKEALAVLNTDKVLGDSAMAAHAYGKLFMAASFFVGKLPAPANAYSGPLKILGKKFPAIVKIYMPSTHGSEGLDDDFSNFLNGKQAFIKGI